MSLKQNLFFCDVRLQDLHLRNGTITSKELASYLESLPDVTDKAAPSHWYDETADQERSTYEEALETEQSVEIYSEEG